MEQEEKSPLLVGHSSTYGTLKSHRQTMDSELEHAELVPRLSLVIMVVGTWGDIQPFIALGQKLEASHGHHVRLSTNVMYGEHVKNCGLEYYPLGGDPQCLSALMVENNGILPSSFNQLQREREEYKKIINSTWAACVEPSIDTGRPFQADAIIANPPASGHVHCAQKLGIPLHMVFTMPWSPTKDYPHPFSSLTYKPGKQATRNWLSYYEIEGFTNTGVMDITNKFRKEILGLEPLVPTDGAATLLYKLDLPFSYAWSPHLAPKPSDWGDRIDVVGFMSLDSAPASYEPPAEVETFLSYGQPPVYIGFGSMFIKDPARVARNIFSAVEKAGMRAVVSRGWAKLGEAEGLPIPQNILLVDSVPHTWLFPRCSAVVHHGGAGTVANALLAGRPSMVVPFFGDQYFWGELIHQKGLGPPPVNIGKLDEQKLLDGLQFMCTPEVQQAARTMSTMLQRENGVEKAVEAFHRHLPVEKMTCDLAPSRVAHTFCLDCNLKLSSLADQVIHGEQAPGRMDHKRVVYEPVDWSPHVYRQPGHDISVGLVHFFVQISMAITGIVLKPYHGWTSAGFPGFLIGILKAVILFFCRPIRGLQLFLGGSGRGLLEWVNGRPPTPWAKYNEQKKALREKGEHGGENGGGGQSHTDGTECCQVANSGNANPWTNQPHDASSAKYRWWRTILHGVRTGVRTAISALGTALVWLAQILEFLTRPISKCEGKEGRSDGGPTGQKPAASNVPASEFSAVVMDDNENPSIQERVGDDIAEGRYRGGSGGEDDISERDEILQRYFLLKGPAIL